MTIFETASAATEPLTLAQVRAHLRLDGTEEDLLLSDLIRVAREHLERETGLALISRVFRACFDSWPQDAIVTIAKGPVRSIQTVRIYDGAGQPADVSLDGHLLDGEARPARLWLRDTPPPEQALNGIEIDFTAGFGEAGTDVPETLKRAMLLHIAAMFACRGVVEAEAQPAIVPPGYDRLIAPYCRRSL